MRKKTKRVHSMERQLSRTVSQGAPGGKLKLPRGVWKKYPVASDRLLRTISSSAATQRLPCSEHRWNTLPPCHSRTPQTHNSTHLMARHVGFPKLGPKNRAPLLKSHLAVSEDLLARQTQRTEQGSANSAAELIFRMTQHNTEKTPKSEDQSG